MRQAWFYCESCCVLDIQNEYFMGYKQARRREDDIAIVNAGFRLLLENETSQPMVKELALCYGGMSFITVSAFKTEQNLLGRCVFGIVLLAW